MAASLPMSRSTINFASSRQRSSIFLRGLREAPVTVREVSVTDGVAGDDQTRDIAMPDRKNPTGHQQPNGH